MNLQDIRDLSPFDLAQEAGCAEPDSRDSAGAEFLIGVRDAVVEILEEDPANDDWHGVADDAPSIFTRRRWLEFVDLCAYEEEPEIVSWPDDLTDAAAVALYQIADRLAYALADQFEAKVEDEDPRRWATEGTEYPARKGN